MGISVNIAAIQIARLKKGYSQRELARASGLSTIAVNYLEKGRSNPRPQTLKKICAALDLDITQICQIILENEK